MRCEGKVAVVTGGGSGLGRAIAIALAKEGAEVVVCDMNEKRATQTITKIKALGHQAMALVVDVSVGADVKPAIKKVLDTRGRIDILVNNAGICHVTPIA